MALFGDVPLRELCRLRMALSKDDEQELVSVLVALFELCVGIVLVLATLGSSVGPFN